MVSTSFRFFASLFLMVALPYVAMGRVPVPTTVNAPPPVPAAVSTVTDESVVMPPSPDGPSDVGDANPDHATGAVEEIPLHATDSGMAAGDPDDLMDPARSNPE